jgi:hypothetical protein
MKGCARLIGSQSKAHAELQLRAGLSEVNWTCPILRAAAGLGWFLSRVYPLALPGGQGSPRAFNLELKNARHS